MLARSICLLLLTKRIIGKHIPLEVYAFYIIKEPRQAELCQHPAGFYNGLIKKALTKNERIKILVCVVIEVTLDVDERCALVSGT